MNTEAQENTIIDGAQGEGGGQIFRTSLTLSMCLGRSVRIDNIRAGRKKPGLLRQHLTCLRAAQAICDAKVTGAEIGSTSVSFDPGPVKAGSYKFSVGSAGSTTLVFQTVLLPLMLADGISKLHIEGGTHNGMAPSYDFIAESFLPLIQRMGGQVETKLESYGFYPAGGGALKARIHPATALKPLNLTSAEHSSDARAVVTSSHIPKHVAERELAQIRESFGWPDDQLEQRLVPSAGPGNLVSLRLANSEVTSVFEAVGERRVSAERVADKAIQACMRFEAAGVAVEEYLADQLILPMALGGGGKFSTVTPSEHLLTNISVVNEFLGVDICLVETGSDQWKVHIHI